MFLNAFRSLELTDIILVPRAFAKIVGVFAGFAGQFMSWGLGTVIKLLEIVFSVVAPGAMGYLRRAGGAIQGIFRNPIGFVTNLVRAAKAGFQRFAGRFFTHLKKGLLDWLTGSLTGVYIPSALSLPEIVKFAFSVLGLTWANLRAKLVTAFGEPAVQAMEKGFDIVKTLVTQGPAAAWEQLKDELIAQKDKVVDGIRDMVIEAVVTKAVPKVVAMFIPGAGFIGAIVSIYDTVMTFVAQLSRIKQVVTSFVDSMMAIAGGAIDAAAARVETTLAGLLSLAINFLAGFAGLGKIANKVKGIIERIRAPVDKALDRAVGWIASSARRLGRFIAQAGVPNDPNERLRLAARAAIAAARGMRGRVTAPLLQVAFAAIRMRFGLSAISAYEQRGQWWVRAVINPVLAANLEVPSGAAAGQPGSVATASLPAGQLLALVLADLRGSGATASNGRLPAAIAALKTRYAAQGLNSVQVLAAGRSAPIVQVDTAAGRNLEGQRIEQGVQLPDYGAVTAMITVDGKGLLPLRNLRGQHAEERILAHLRQYLRALAKPPLAVELLVSQSPCRHQCAPQLSALRAQYPNTSFSLLYRTLHQSTSGTETAESMAALGDLEAAGWAVAIWSGGGNVQSPGQPWLR